MLQTIKSNLELRKKARKDPIHRRI